MRVTNHLARPDGVIGLTPAGSSSYTDRNRIRGTGTGWYRASSAGFDAILVVPKSPLILRDRRFIIQILMFVGEIM